MKTHWWWTHSLCSNYVQHNCPDHEKPKMVGCVVFSDIHSLIANSGSCHYMLLLFLYKARVGFKLNYLFLFANTKGSKCVFVFLAKFDCLHFLRESRPLRSLCLSPAKLLKLTSLQIEYNRDYLNKDLKIFMMWKNEVKNVRKYIIPSLCISMWHIPPG